jgi:hypothetical protein
MNWFSNLKKGGCENNCSIYLKSNQLPKKKREMNVIFVGVTT